MQTFRSGHDRVGSQRNGTIASSGVYKRHHDCEGAAWRGIRRHRAIAVVFKTKNPTRKVHRFELVDFRRSRSGRDGHGIY